MGGIGNDCGDDTCREQTTIKQHVRRRVTGRVITLFDSGTNLGRGKPAALRYRAKADSREVF